MRKLQENSGFGVMTSQKPDLESRNADVLYQKCVQCPDYGVTCNGPKLAALGDIMIVREFHRAIRDQREIPMKLIHLAAQPVGESTVNDYFSHSTKDFKWTTVGCIDNALTAICGNRVGQPPLDNPCPASSSEIQQKQSEAAQRYAELEAECFRLRDRLAEAKEKHIDQMNEYRVDQQKRVDFLKALAESRYQLILRRDRKITVLSVIIAILFAALSFYLVWDIMHPGVGLLQW